MLGAIYLKIKKASLFTKRGYARLIFTDFTPDALPDKTPKGLFLLEYGSRDLLPVRKMCKPLHHGATSNM